MMLLFKQGRWKVIILGLAVWAKAPVARFVGFRSVVALV